MKKFFAVLMLAAVFMTAGCAKDVRDLEFTGDNTEEIIDTMFKSEDLSEDEKLKLTLEIGRAQALGRDLEGKTVGDLLKDEE